MFPFERYQAIMNLLKEHNELTVPELSESLKVSISTIRNDLNKLEQDRKIKKIHGGARIIKQEEKFTDFNERLSKNIFEKEAIAHAALAYISHGQIITLDSSSTVLPLASSLDNFDGLTVLTNGLYTALETKDFINVNTIITGGTLTRKGFSVEGLLGKSIVENIHSDCAFFSGGGFSLEEGFTAYNIYEVELLRELFKKSKRKIALLDHSKLEVVSSAKFADAAEIDLVITDSNADPKIIEAYRQFGLEVVIAPKR